MSDTSTRFGISEPSADRHDPADVPLYVRNVVAALEALGAQFGFGTLANLPSGHIQGRFYIATDQSPVQLLFDTGTAWLGPLGGVGAGSVGTAQIADGAVTGGAAGSGVKIAAATITHDNIAAGAVRSNEILDGTIVATDIAAALFPSQGAGNGTEALRAIGSGAGQVVAGNDSRLTDVRAPSVGHDPSVFGTSFPTTGLFNGYRTAIFLANPAGGSNMYTAMYRADLDATYPWHVSGAPIMNEILSYESTTSTGYTSLGTAGPSITIARAGVWRVAIGSWASGSSSFTDETLMSYNIGGTGASDADAVIAGTSSGGTRAESSGARPRVKTITAAATALVSQYRTTGGSTQFWANRWMEAQPLRLI